MTIPDGPTLAYDPEVGPGYFVQARADFLRWPGFPPTFKVLYLVLCSYAGSGVTAWPGQDRLAHECGVSVRTIRTVLDDLAAAGLVSITQVGLNRPNRYYIHKLPTVPPTKERQILPVPQERKRLPVLNGNGRRSRAATGAAEVHVDQTHPAENGGNVLVENELRRLCKARGWPPPTPADYAAVGRYDVATLRQAALGARSLADVTAGALVEG